MPPFGSRPLGYAFWSLNPYEANLLENPGFEMGTSHWEVGDGRPDLGRDATTDRPFLRLPPKAWVRQAVHAEWNPGCAHPHIPFTLRFRARSDHPTFISIRYDVLHQGDWALVLEARLPVETARWKSSVAALPFAGHFRLCIKAEDQPIDLDKVEIWNHRQTAAALDPKQLSARGRREILSRHHRAWSS